MNVMFAVIAFAFVNLINRLTVLVVKQHPDTYTSIIGDERRAVRFDRLRPKSEQSYRLCDHLPTSTHTHTHIYTDDDAASMMLGSINIFDCIFKCAQAR